jgi:mannose-6-phosphate isomerase-like protein (cupin superfamily)
VKTRLRPGDTILTGGGAGHAIKSVGEEPLEMIAVISKHPKTE